MMASTEQPPPGRPYVAREASECKRLAEDSDLPAAERLVWAVLALAAEVRAARGRR